MTDPRTTPGPWVWAHKHGTLCRVGEPPRPYGQAVLSPTYEYDSGIDVEVSEADAALIAAAPDLYAALADLVRTLQGRPDIVQLCGFQERAQLKVACDALNKVEKGRPE